MTVWTEEAVAVKKGMKERRIKNRQMILKIIRKKTMERRDLKEAGGPWWESGPALDYWKFLKDLEEGRIKRLNGRKIG
jgi:hypothetical protein